MLEYGENMNIEEKEELLKILSKTLVRLREINSLMRSGKIIVGNEKLQGIIKILSTYATRIEMDKSEIITENE
jgi:hypothetical protein